MSKVLHPTTSVETRDAEILWLTPDKPENLSIGRRRIAEGLENKGYTITCEPRRLEHAKTQLTSSYDVLLGTTSLAGIMGMESVIRDKAFVVDHVDPISQMYRTADYKTARLVETLQDIAFRLADGILYVYDEEQDRLTGTSATVQQTTLGVDYERFQNPTTESIQYVTDALSQSGVTGEFATYIGGLEEIYNIPDLLESAVIGEYELVIAGQGKYETECWKATAKYENIHYLGSMPHEHIPALLHHAGAGVCLVDDPHTVKVLEYGAAGLPVVQLRGRAENTLPNGAVEWVSSDPYDIARGVKAAMNEQGHLQTYAKDRRWSDVVDEYDEMIQNVL
jgi:glycosyltransferase involved in cell wall biosynthesis